jgi:hypothetical protein
MRYKKILTFVLSAGLCLVAAAYRWGDSGHTIGLVSLRGGRVRHPSVLKGGHGRYTQLVTATVLPGYHGNARLALEGSPPLPWEMHLTAPAVDLGLRRKPRLENRTLIDLQPRDRIALWLVMHPLPGMIEGRYVLAFHDSASGRSLLRVPIIFKTAEDKDEQIQNR